MPNSISTSVVLFQQLSSNSDLSQRIDAPGESLVSARRLVPNGSEPLGGRATVEQQQQDGATRSPAACN